VPTAVTAPPTTVSTSTTRRPPVRKRGREEAVATGTVPVATEEHADVIAVRQLSKIHRVLHRWSTSSKYLFVMAESDVQAISSPKFAR
jgi:hypothetical protein